MELKTCSVKMVYSGKSTHITCPSTSKYEDFIKIAMERFSIAIEFKAFIRLYGGHRYVFAKRAFDTYLMRYPNPEMLFEIRIDYLQMLENLHLHDRTDSTSRNLKLPRDETCSEDYDVDKPKVKRVRSDLCKGSDPMEFE